MKLLSIGAEATVYANDKIKAVVKQRQPKGYRAKELDDRLRLSRMRREVKVIEALQQLEIPVPKLIGSDEKTAAITMQLIEGRKARDVLSGDNYRGICSEIGKSIGLMHKNNMIHGDLTTSNMIIGNNKRVHFIDFGLSLFSNKDEDKAVDLHLFRQALNSSHSRIAEKCFDAAIAAYKKANSSGWKAVLNRLERVKGR